MNFFYIFWGTQFFSTLGSSMSGYALSLWIYEQTGSALAMSLLSMAASLPNLLALFAGPLADRFSRKAMIAVCDACAGAATLCLCFLTSMRSIPMVLLYGVCFMQSLFNVFQAPASDAATTSLIKPDQYQKTAGIRSLGYAVNSFLAPGAGGLLYLALGLSSVLFFDLLTCITAIAVLLFFIPLPAASRSAADQSWRSLWKGGFFWLNRHRLVSGMMIYMGFVNLINAVYETAMPVMVLNRPFGGEALLSFLRAAAGASMCLAAAGMLFSKRSGNPLRIITVSIGLSFAAETILLSLAPNAAVCTVAECVGWASIPVMNTYLDVFYRSSIPDSMQGRIFAIRNTISNSVVPAGSLLGGVLLEKELEPWMNQVPGWFLRLFGNGSAGAAACLLFAVGCSGAAVSFFSYFALQHIRKKENSPKISPMKIG